MPLAPAAKRVAMMTRRLRPELVTHNSLSLNSDSFSEYEEKDDLSEEQRKALDVRSACLLRGGFPRGCTHWVGVSAWSMSARVVCRCVRGGRWRGGNTPVACVGGVAPAPQASPSTPVCLHRPPAAPPPPRLCVFLQGCVGNLYSVCVPAAAATLVEMYGQRMLTGLWEVEPDLRGAARTIVAQVRGC